ncbi:MAG: hypothetical protein EAX86_09285 [Candidatus Heimdallarchaeota archaeon]|nr:hypothetical protein [Candidatus Heimdallarchaeota archaeon]
MVPIEIVAIYLLGVYLIVVGGGILVVGLILKVLRTNKKSESVTPTEGIHGAGIIVGILERTIILTLGLLNQYSAISFVLAAKSMARFKQLEKQDFAEYYLIGTLSSFSIAIICAILAQAVYQFYLVPLFP